MQHIYSSSNYEAVGYGWDTIHLKSLTSDRSTILSGSLSGDFLLAFLSVPEAGKDLLCERYLTKGNQ